MSSFLSQLESIPSSHLARFTIVWVGGGIVHRIITYYTLCCDALSELFLMVCEPPSTTPSSPKTVISEWIDFRKGTLVFELVFAKYCWHFYRYSKCFGKGLISRGWRVLKCEKEFQQWPETMDSICFWVIVVELSCGKSRSFLFNGTLSALSTHSPPVHHSFCHPFESNHDW